MAVSGVDNIGVDLSHRGFEVELNSSQGSDWSLGCDITIEDVDATIQEIKVADVILEGSLLKEELTVDINPESESIVDLDVNVVVNGIGTSLVESQIVPFSRIISISDHSSEATNELGYASSAYASKKIYDLISALGLRVDKIEANGGGGNTGGGSYDSYWYLKDGKLHVNYDIVVHGNSVVEGDSSSGGDGEGGGSTGGGGFLSSLGDVRISSPSNGDVLVYNTLLGKWVNTSQSSIVPDLTGYAKTSYVNSEIKKISDALAAMWQIDENGNLVTDKQVIIKNNLIVNGDTASGGDGQNTVVGITGILVGNSIYKDLDSDGLIDLTKAFEGLSVDVDLSNYYTKQEVDNKIAGIDFSPYAKKTELEALQNEVNAIESMLGTDAKDTIDTWNEVVAFLDGYKDSDDLATILSSMNGKIDANTQGIATINNTLSPIKSWYDTLSGLIVNDNGNVRIKTNLIVEGDSASGGEGDVTTQGIVGIKVNGRTYKDSDDGIIDGIIDLGTISGGGGLTSVSWADIADRPTALSEFENDLSSSDIAQILGYTPVRPTTLNNFLPKTGGQLTGALQIFDHMIYDDDGAFSIDAMDTISLYAPNDIVISSDEGQLYFNGKPVLTEHQSLAGYQPLITDLGTIRSGAALGATAVQPATLNNYATNTALSNGLATKQNTISDLATIRSGAALGASAVQPATLTSALAGYLPLSGGTLNGALTVNGGISGASTIQANSIICGTTRLRVNATGSVTSFGFIDAVLYGSTNNRSTVHIGSCYGGSSTITNTTEYPSGVSMTAISMYRGSVGIGKRFSDSELDTAYKAGIMLTVAGSQTINGNLVVTGDISA